MQEASKLKGRVVHADSKRLILANGYELYCSLDKGCTWQKWISLPQGILSRILVKIPLTNRLLRRGLHHLTFDGSDAVAIVNKQIIYCSHPDEFVSIGTVCGSRPLSLCAVGGTFYYGEYRSNPERSPVHVWSWRFGDSAWSKSWVFEDIRHVHGVFHDPYTGAVWVTTGDTDAESAIWRTDDNFATLERIAGGNQQFRVVQLIFTPCHIYFGSDAPNETNFIYRMDKNGQNLEQMALVGGSVFYGISVGESLFFSTAVEPSKVNQTRFAEVWRSDNGTEWKLFASFAKDFLPMKFFQYGQVFFPSGTGDGNNLWITPFATKDHGMTFKFPVCN